MESSARARPFAKGVRGRDWAVCKGVGGRVRAVVEGGGGACVRGGRGVRVCPAADAEDRACAFVLPAAPEVSDDDLWLGGW